MFKAVRRRRLANMNRAQRCHNTSTGAVKAKFHYAVQLTSSGRTPVRDQIPLHYPACDQVASRSATSSPAGLRAASELGENLRVHVVCVSQAKFHYAVQLASRSQTSSRPNSITLSSLGPAREQVYNQLASWFGSC